MGQEVIDLIDLVRTVLGVGLVPYSPLGRGFLTGTVKPDSLGEKDFRGHNPRFVGDAGRANQAIAALLGRSPSERASAPRRSPWRGSTAKRRGSASASRRSRARSGPSGSSRMSPPSRSPSTPMSSRCCIRWATTWLAPATERASDHRSYPGVSCANTCLRALTCTFAGSSCDPVVELMGNHKPDDSRAARLGRARGLSARSGSGIGLPYRPVGWTSRR